MAYPERELDLINLIWKIIFAWRRMIVFGLIFAVIVPALMYVKDGRAYSAYLAEQEQREIKKAEEKKASEEEKEDSEKEVEKTELSDFSDSDVKQIEEALAAKERLKKAEDAMESSALMELDPSNVPTCELIYYVETDWTYNYSGINSPDYTGDVVSLYTKAVEGGEILGENTEASDLVTVSSDGNLFTVMIYYPDLEGLVSLKENIKKGLSERTEGIASVVGSHRLTLFSERSFSGPSKEISDKQKEERDSCKALKTDYESLLEKMSEDQKKYVMGPEYEEAEEAEPPSLKIKYILLGFFVGIFIAALLYAMIEVLSPTLRTAEEVQEVFKLNVPGQITKKRKYKGLDKLLYDLRYKNRRMLGLEESIDLLSSNVELQLKSGGMEKIYFTGTRMDVINDMTLSDGEAPLNGTATQSVISRFTADLKEKGIEVNSGDNICFSEASLRKATEYGNILLLEVPEKSRYDEIEKEISAAREQKINIVGIVPVEI